MNMKFFFQIVFCLILTFLTNAENYANDLSDALKLVITTDQEAYRIGQQMYIKAEVINTSNGEQCFRTIFYFYLKLVVNNKTYKLGDNFSWECSPPIAESYRIAGGSAISRITYCSFYSNEINLEELKGPFELYAELPIETNCKAGKSSYTTLKSEKVKIDILPMSEEERTAWSDARKTSIKVQEPTETAPNYEVTVASLLPSVYGNDELKDIFISSVKSFIQKHAGTYYAERLKLRLALNELAKGNLKEAEDLFGSIKEKDNEYFVFKLRLINALFNSSMSNSDAISKANQLLDEVSKNQGKGILSEIIKKRVENNRQWVAKWATERQVKNSE
jgi:hypothetical protein